MGRLNAADRAFLTEYFGDRVSFNRIERKLYSHDIAALPSLFKPLVGNTMPDAVVQPTSEDEVVALMKWALANRVPLTPRAKSTSGYGGVVPIKRGVVVDFYRMKRMLEVDAEVGTVTVEPGIVWERLDKQLSEHGLTLRLYPTSYPSSTAGGWLAQGGAGLGSYEYGWFRDNVASARVVLPSGEVRDFAGEELGLVSEAEGVTGFITRLTLRVQPRDELKVVALGTPDPRALQRFAEEVISAQLPIWSMSFINPKMAELKSIAPVMEHFGHPVEDQMELPHSYIITLAVRERAWPAVEQALAPIQDRLQISTYPDEIPRHEWDNRFKLMVVKRLGPSLVPTEVVVPLSSLGDLLKQTAGLISQPLVKEGVVIRNGANGAPEVVILGFIPSDQRKFTYNFVFGLALTLIRLAEKHGGRPYSTGMYFTTRAGKVMGKERYARLRAFKRQSDPTGILNPGKVTSGTLTSLALSLAGRFEPLVRPFGNAVKVQVGERASKPVRDIPADVAWYAYSCSQCGYCVDECDQFYGRGWESQSPRGKWYWLREYMEGREDWNQQMVDTVLSCTTCEMCNHRCSAALPIEPSWMKLRGKLIHDDKKMTFPPFEMMGAALHAEGDIWAGYRKDRANWFPADLVEKHGPAHQSKNVYFAGCTASYVENDIAMATVRLLDEANVDFTYLGEKESCCATPMLVAGKLELFVETMRKNIAAVKEAGADTVISSCPACDMMWRQVYPQWARKLGIEYGIKARHYSEVVSEKLKSGEMIIPKDGHEPVTVTWHDSCHMGRVSGVYQPPRDLIEAVPHATLVEMEHNRDCSLCCGSVLTLIKEPDVAARLGKTRLDEAVAAGAQKVLALCPCCEFQLRVSRDKLNLPVEVQDLAHFTADALGYKFPDPHPEVQYQWSVFEAMIKLMTPQGFAGLMGTMWPELIAAMPLGMGKMMHVMAKVPGALDAMKPMFPILFPRLLPMMMPKVMPTMLARVKDMVPMPDYMAEQMPELMPKVMDNLMPHMIGDLVPLVTQPMINYLKGMPAE